MKKLLIAVGLGLLSGSLYAACYGPLCYDENGVTINGLPVATDKGTGVKSLTISQSSNTVPTQAGVMIYCSNCYGGGTAGTICVSTAAAIDSFVLSTGTHCR